MIAPITRDVADYLRSFDLAVIFITPAGRIGTARGLSPASRISAAWWTQGRAAAESVLVAIGEHHPGTLEGATRAVLQAAARLGVVLGEHETVVGSSSSGGPARSTASWARGSSSAACGSLTGRLIGTALT